jgi:hypothetical protein
MSKDLLSEGAAIYISFKEERSAHYESSGQSASKEG